MSVKAEEAQWDLTTPSGIKVEVKSAAYIQSWFQASLSSIEFRVPTTRSFDLETGKSEQEAMRQAHVYLLALFIETDLAALDPSDVTQWRFYVLPTSKLNERERSQCSITLNSVKGLFSEESFTGLNAAVAKAAEENHQVTASTDNYWDATASR